MEIDKSKENYKTGYIWLWRSLKNRAFFKKPDYLALWILLLLKATRKELKLEVWFKGQSIFLKPGQFLTGRKKLSIESGINESKIERILNYFEKIEQQIEQQKSTKNRIISILNWNRYQSLEQQIEQQLNNKRTTTEQQVNTDNKGNKENKDNNIYSREIIDYLNTKANTSFKHNMDKTKSIIEARLNEGFSLEDFKKVINVKVKDWLHDEKMNKYLRPITLFSNKFESYLAEANTKPIKETPKTMPWKYDKK